MSITAVATTCRITPSCLFLSVIIASHCSRQTRTCWWSTQVVSETKSFWGRHFVSEGCFLNSRLSIVRQIFALSTANGAAAQANHPSVGRATDKIGFTVTLHVLTRTRGADGERWPSSSGILDGPEQRKGSRRKPFLPSP